MEEIQLLTDKEKINPGELASLSNKINHDVEISVRVKSKEGKIITKSDWKEVLTKKWYESKTIIINLLLAIFTGIGSLLSDESFKLLVGDNFAIILTFITIGNMYLRLTTNSAVSIKEGVN